MFQSLLSWMMPLGLSRVISSFLLRGCVGISEARFHAFFYVKRQKVAILGVARKDVETEPPLVTLVTTKDSLNADISVAAIAAAGLPGGRLRENAGLHDVQDFGQHALDLGEVCVRVLQLHDLMVGADEAEEARVTTLRRSRE